MMRPTALPTVSAEQRLPLIVLDRYLFFLSRRPISQSNLHYAWQRIAGLRALGQTLQAVEVEDQQIGQVVKLLRGMQPQNLQEMTKRLQLTLHPLARTTLPADVLVINRPVQADFWSGLKRILLLTGPAIGIGDEVITFPLPAWLKDACPAAEIVLLSGYDGIWRGVRGVDSVHHYRDYLTLVQALRGELALGRFDLVFLLDFESPDLYQAVCEEKSVPRYVELSLGAHRAAVVDNERRRLYRLQAPPGYFGNYYHGFDYLLAMLGLRPKPAGRFSVARPPARPAEGGLRLYVSPFTSKYDPSPLYWSGLLAAVVAGTTPNRLEVVLDPGPNLATWRFAQGLARSLSAQLPVGATAQVASGANGRNLPLAEVVAELEQAQVAICADSFTAHLAPAQGRPALVLAGRELSDWRAPAPASFYFGAETPLAEVAAGMRQVLSHFGLVAAGDFFRPAVGEAEARFLAAGRLLAERLADGPEADLAGLVAGYRELAASAQAAVRRLPFWPPACKSLLDDYRYDQPWHTPAGEEVAAGYGPDLRHHIANAVQSWGNTNLYKYLAMVSET